MVPNIFLKETQTNKLTNKQKTAKTNPKNPHNKTKQQKIHKKQQQQNKPKQNKLFSSTIPEKPNKLQPSNLWKKLLVILEVNW